MDALSLGISVLVFIAGIVAVLLSLRARAVREAGQGEYFSLLLGSIAGMVVLAQAESLITLFVGLELLSIPLYALCATELRAGRRSRPGSSTWCRLGGLGHPALRAGADLRRDRGDGLPRHRGRDRRTR